MENFKKYATSNNKLYISSLLLLKSWVESKYNGKLEIVHKFMFKLQVHNETFTIKINLSDNHFYCLDKEDQFIKVFYSIDGIKEWIDMGCLIFSEDLDNGDLSKQKS
jgi:hypothetical protein